MTRAELNEYRGLSIELVHTKDDKEKAKIQQRIEKIESYIASIPNAITRTIFKAVFMEGATQVQIADEINYSQAAVSKRINKYLKEE